jgi:3-hydroxyacyl-CoA dehydrogenase / enoyl-CoA hydratase / 3-hydroxybutyryl-CoA epimerase
MIRTLFLDKGAADKLARRPKAVEKAPVRKLGVLGAGMMGAGIAYVSASAGIEVVLLDTDQGEAEKGKGYSQGLLEKRVGRGRMAPEKGRGGARAHQAHRQLR